MKCPKCKTECLVNLRIERPKGPVTLAPKKTVEIRCPRCGYTKSELKPYKEIKTCPDCKNEKSVVKKKDTKTKTKIGYFYYCKKCKKEFPAKWE